MLPQIEAKEQATYSVHILGGSSCRTSCLSCLASLSLIIFYSQILNQVIMWSIISNHERSILDYRICNLNKGNMEIKNHIMLRNVRDCIGVENIMVGNVRRDK
jgi:hypothetical protein